MPGVTPAAVNNVTFYTLILAQLWNVFNMSPREVPFLNNQITRNRYIWYALIFCIAVTVLMNFIPSLRSALSLVDFNADVLAIIIAASILPVALVQFLKRTLKIIR
jgi:Ca2+-transporting ATPase